MEEVNMTFEEEYGDVLQNIEFGIVQVYREHPETLDADVLMALEALIQYYNAMARGKPAALRSLAGVQGQVAGSVKAMCDWRLGQAQLRDEHDRPIEMGGMSKTPEEIVACLKRVRKSADLHTRRDGRRGYLDFIVDYVM
jgi:hypothetical protein